MSEDSGRRSAYDGLLIVDSDARAPGAPGVYIEDQPDLGIITVRGQSDEAEFLDRIQQVLGVRLPTHPSTTALYESTRALWIGPDEWWIMCPGSRAGNLVPRLQSAVDGLFAQVIDNSAGLAALRLTGGDHLTMLRHLCPYPVESIRVGGCVSTVFPKANVTLLKPDSASTLLISRRSYAHWISQLLMRSARPYGLALLNNHT